MSIYTLEAQCPPEPGFCALPEAKLHLHSEPLQLLRRFWSFAYPDNEMEDFSDEEFLQQSTGAIDSTGAECEVTIQQQLDGIQEAGIWAFADCDKNEINIWVTHGLPHVLATHIIAHELGHLIIDSAEDMKTETKKMAEDCLEEEFIEIEGMSIPKEEYMVDMFGWVCRQTNTWLVEIDDYFQENLTVVKKPDALSC